MAATAAAASFLRQTVFLSSHQQDANQTGNQTVLYLALGALIGVAYSLGTEKFMRAMQHRHIFVRNAMLWLSAVAWLFAAAAVGRIASLIYNQVGGGLEGFDRVLGVLIPFVVRADLVVDWAKRVAWALLNMATWTQGAVQLRRLLGRAEEMTGVVGVDSDVAAMAKVHVDIASEDRVWAEDTDSLVRMADVWQHFGKLGRVAVYAVGGLVFVLPAAVGWVVYALFYGVRSVCERELLMAVLYLLSIVLTPVGVVIAVIACVLLLGGVVTLSVVGTMIQFLVYWSTRTVYSMVRVGMSQAWAGFPDVTVRKRKSVRRHVVEQPSGSFAVRPVRDAEEAGAAIAQMGSFMPTEMEFALASWDGYKLGDNMRPSWLTSILSKLNIFGEDEDSDEDLSDDPGGLSVETSTDSMHAIVSPVKRMSSAEAAEGAETFADVASSDQVQSRDHVMHHRRLKGRQGVKDNDVVLTLLGRLGLDLSVKTPRRRRLSTYYAFGMLAHLQVESGGNAWCLHSLPEVSDNEFDNRVASLNCIVADEARTSLEELAARLRGTSKYRLIPTGAPNSRMVPVTCWLRAALLAFLETPCHTESGKRSRDLSTA